MSSNTQPQRISHDRIQTLVREFNDYLKPMGLFLEPFLLHQYNEQVEKDFQIGVFPSQPHKEPLNEKTLCFLVGSNGQFCGPIMRQFASNLPYDMEREFKAAPVHCITRYYLKQFLIAKLYREFGYNVETLHDFDMINNRPRLLVQSAGHCSGMAYYYQPQDFGFEEELPYGCSLHSTYAGWFGFRGAFILNDYVCDDFVAKKPIDVFAGNKEDIRYMLELFNAFDARWRDTVPTLMRYDADQVEFFETTPSKRTIPGPALSKVQKHHEPVNPQQIQGGSSAQVDHKRELSEDHLTFYEQDKLIHDASDLYDNDTEEDDEESKEEPKKTHTKKFQKTGVTLSVTAPMRDAIDIEENMTPADMHEFVDDALDLYDEEERKKNAEKSAE